MSMSKSITATLYNIFMFYRCVIKLTVTYLSASCNTPSGGFTLPVVATESVMIAPQLVQKKVLVDLLR
jgi:hypothetical protein